MNSKQPQSPKTVKQKTTKITGGTQIRQNFQKQVLTTLLEMLEISKQAESVAAQTKIKEYCEQLANWGKHAQIPGWAELLATAKKAIQEKQIYRQATKLIVKEVKEAIETFLKQPTTKITVSKELKNLATINQSKATSPQKNTLTGSRSTVPPHKKSQEVEEKDISSLANIFQEDDSSGSDLKATESLSAQEAVTKELNELLGEDTSGKKSTKQANPSSLPLKETVFLFGKDFTFDPVEDEEISTENQKNYSQPLDIDDLFGDDISGEIEPLAEDNELFSSLEENIAEEKIKPTFKSDKQKTSPGKETMILFGEDFSFDEDDLKNLHDLEGDTSDINDLFSEDLSWKKQPRQWQGSKISLPGKDTMKLFGEDFSFNEDGEQKQRNVSRNLDNEINNLFEDDVTELESVEDDLFPLDEEINNLFDEDFDAGEIKTVLQINKQEKEDLIYYYEALEALEALLAEPAAKQMMIDWQQLEAQINAAAGHTVNWDKSLREKAIVIDAETEEDDEFADLEDLLEQTDPGMSGMPSNAAGGRNAQGRAAKSVFEQTMKVPVKQLDNINNMMGELVVNRNSLEQDQERLRQFLDNLLNHVGNLSDVGARMQDLYERSLLESSLLASRENSMAKKHKGGKSTSTSIQEQKSEELDYDPLEMDKFTGFHLLSQEMIELIVRVREASSDIQFLVDETEQVARNLRQISTQMQEGLNKSRMVPWADTADRMRRAVRNICLKLNKQAELNVEGRDVLIDKMIAEHLYDPMTHLVNNAMTHGVETPEERLAKGKPAKGNITISAFIQGNQTIISVGDDGAGIDPTILKHKAIEKGLLTSARAKQMSAQEAYDLIFHAGFSTKDKADDFSGRGVGMDVVRTSLNEIRGVVSIDSTVGKGTTFTIRLPLTLSISKALCCVSNHARIAFPMDGVEDMQDYFPTDIQTSEKGEKMIPWRDTLLPFRPLTELLAYHRQIGRSSVYSAKREDDMISIVVLRSAGNFLAVQVDQVLGEQEIVIKQIKGPIPKPIGIAGATVLGDGRIMAIADVLELIEISQGRIRQDLGSIWDAQAAIQEEVEDHDEAMVLIVDDSITVRELLSMTFTKAGYRVEQARDGQEGWEKLRSGLPCDIVLCDVEMPRMDGLELLANIQKDENLHHIPVAMLTSRGAERHRQVAAQLGASGYFIKPYLEEVLLDGTRRMMRGEILLPNSTRKPTQPKPKQKSARKVEQPPAKQPQPMTHQPIVLIIDDSIVVRELLSVTFKNAGYLVEQARDGQEAWDKLNGGLTCDVAFCDIEMPKMNGLDLLANLQQNEKLSHIPVAMLTSRGAERHRRLAAERGAKGYFTKPYLDEVLIDAAQRLMRGEVLLNASTKVESY